MFVKLALGCQQAREKKAFSRISGAGRRLRRCNGDNALQVRILNWH